MTRDDAVSIAIRFRNSLRLGGAEIPGSYISLYVTDPLDESGKRIIGGHAITVALTPEIEKCVAVPSDFEGLRVMRHEWEGCRG